MNRIKNIFLSLLICSFLISCIPPFSCKKWIEEEIVPKEYKGVIKSKIESPYNMGKIVFKSNDTLTVCRTSPSGFWDNVIVDDSIFKKRGEQLITVYSKDTIKSYDFPCCDW